MRTYQWLSRFFPRSYQAKLLAVAFCCTTLPLLVLALWLLAQERATPDELVSAAVLGLAAVIAGGVLSLLLLNKLLAPLRLAADALDQYYREQKLPWLPAVGDDDMARLLRGINRCLRGIDVGRRQLERHAIEDPLTHALNRRGCERALADSMTLASNGHRPLVLLVVDLDNLKQINDEHGHVAGDRALTSVVDTARRTCLGEHDWIGRWGGDEFVLGMHDGLEAVKMRVNDWLGLLETSEEGRFPVYVSAGCANYRPGVSMDALYRQADDAMYEAKFSGGHRLICKCAGEPSRTRARPAPGHLDLPERLPAGPMPAMAGRVGMAAGR